MIQLVRKAPAPLAGHGLILGVTFCLVNLPLAPIRMNDAYDSRAVEKFYTGAGRGPRQPASGPPSSSAPVVRTLLAGIWWRLPRTRPPLGPD